jgi:hypothetical protein
MSHDFATVENLFIMGFRRKKMRTLCRLEDGGVCLMGCGRISNATEKLANG